MGTHRRFFPAWWESENSQPLCYLSKPSAWHQNSLALFLSGWQSHANAGILSLLIFFSVLSHFPGCVLSLSLKHTLSLLPPLLLFSFWVAPQLFLLSLPGWLTCCSWLSCLCLLNNNWEQGGSTAVPTLFRETKITTRAGFLAGLFASTRLLILELRWRGILCCQLTQKHFILSIDSLQPWRDHERDL